MRKEETRDRNRKKDSPSSGLGADPHRQDSCVDQSAFKVLTAAKAIGNPADKSLKKEDQVSDQNSSSENAQSVTFNEKSVTSCHSYYGSSIAKVKEVVDQSPISISAIEISQTTGLKHSTVRKCLNRLERKGFVRKFCYGYYVSLRDNATLPSSVVRAESDILAGQKVVELRLHCLRLRVVDVVGEPMRWARDSDVVKISFARFKNGTATVFVDCQGDYSFDYVAFRLLIDRVLSELDVSDWSKVIVSTFELNNDYEGAKLEGCQAVTFKSFDGSFRRVYNKKYGLRDEVKAVGSRRVEDVLALLQGGISNYNILQLLFLNFQEIKANHQDSKIKEKLFADAASSMRRLADAVFKLNEKRGAA